MIYYDTVQSGLVPIKPLEFQLDSFGTRYLKVEVLKTTGAYPKGHHEYLLWPNRFIVEKSFVSQHKQWVHQASREQVLEAMA